MISIKRTLENEAATRALGHELSLFAKKGMVICLYGDLGAGKTTLARALIQALSDQGENLEVPSPTFALLQPYEDLRLSVHHYDLYRIADIDEAYELGLFDDQEERLTLIEWPERLGDQLPENRIDVCLEINNDHRLATISGSGAIAVLVNRVEMVAGFLSQADWKDARRCFLQGDASARRYERLTKADGAKAILMDMPDLPDGPAIKAGKTYGQIAHIAEGIFPVAAVNAELIKQGFCAPASLQQDLTNGFMLIEDFGDQVFGAMFQRGEDISQPLLAATELLAEMTIMNWPDHIPVPGEIKNPAHTIAKFDHAAFEMEASLLLEWYWPMVKENAPDNTARQAFFDAWKTLFPLTECDHPVWVLRDFHSPNLIWLPERSGTQRVGLIDTQDCLMGHPAYDLVSMLQDARIDLPDGYEAKYYKHYCKQRHAQDNSFDEDAFSAAYAVLGAQRSTKILGIFARLFKRDGKSGYLQHIPRVSKALENNLQHPALSNLAHWYQTYLPAQLRKAYKAP